MLYSVVFGRALQDFASRVLLALLPQSLNFSQRKKTFCELDWVQNTNWAMFASGWVQRSSSQCASLSPVYSMWKGQDSCPLPTPTPIPPPSQVPVRALWLITLAILLPSHPRSESGGLTFRKSRPEPWVSVSPGLILSLSCFPILPAGLAWSTKVRSGKKEGPQILSSGIMFWSVLGFGGKKSKQ